MGSGYYAPPWAARPPFSAPLAALLVAAGCGGEIEVPKQQATAHEGAVLFNERCSGCHSLDAANAYGSQAAEADRRAASAPTGRTSTCARRAATTCCSRSATAASPAAIMPANVVVGDDAEAVADFLSKYSGKGD